MTIKVAKQSRPHKTKRVSKTDWLNEAIRVLVTSGVSAIRVERLAASLGVAKSGFYYHFRDRKGLLDALLEHWLNIDHAPMNRQMLMENPTPEQMLRNVISTVHELKLGQLDFAIRQWAATDDRVTQLYNQEMQARIDHISSIFKALGYKGDDLKARVYTFVGYTLMEAQLFPEAGPEERDRLWDRRIRLLTRP